MTTISSIQTGFTPDYAIAEIAKDSRRKAWIRTCVLQLLDNAEDLAISAISCSFKCWEIFFKNLSLIWC